MKIVILDAYYYPENIAFSHLEKDIIEGLISNPTVTSAVEAFKKDFEGLVGAGKTMLDC